MRPRIEGLKGLKGLSLNLRIGNENRERFDEYSRLSSLKAIREPTDENLTRVKALGIMRDSLQAAAAEDPEAFFKLLGGKKKRKSLKKKRKSKRRKSLKKKQRKTKRKGRR